MTLRGWPHAQPFPESLRETEPGAGPDFPDSSGDRERGKFRPGSIPRTTAIAVVGDDGEPLARSTEELLEEILLYQKALLVALSMLAEGAGFSAQDALTAVS